MGNPFSVPAAPPTTKHFTDFVKTLPRMDGKTVAITGCTSGTGLVLAHTCVDLGATVVMLNRPSERAEKALAGLRSKSASFVPCDLESFASVRAAAVLLHAQCLDGIDVLCCNAGVMGLADRATADGFDVQMQPNHLSHFLLVSEVFPLLKLAASKRGEARIVNHSSGARLSESALLPQYFGRNGGNLGGDGFPGIGKWHRYGQTKLANLMFTYALHDKIAAERPGCNVKVLCAHPGPTATSLLGKTALAGGDRLVDRLILARITRRAHSAEDGTLGICRCTCEPGLASLGFYGPEAPGMPGPAVLLKEERNAANEKVVWEQSMKGTGISKYFGKE